MALCNRCHLLVDLPLHQRHAAETRRLAKEAFGQLPLGFFTQAPDGPEEVLDAP